LDRLIALKPFLVAGGCVQRHRDAFRLRFRQFDERRGYAVHRSLIIGPDPAVAAAVKQQIQRWRGETELAEQQEQETRRQDAQRKFENRALVADVARANGLGQRRQRRALKSFDKASAVGPKAQFLFAWQADFLKTGKPGRPRRRLW